MTIEIVRKQLHQQIDTVPDDIVRQIADFALFVVTRQKIQYGDWDGHEWQDFSLEQFFREGDDVEYSLDDAQEIYRP